jgi:hypothetical protein
VVGRCAFPGRGVTRPLAGPLSHRRGSGSSAFRRVNVRLTESRGSASAYVAAPLFAERAISEKLLAKEILASRRTGSYCDKMAFGSEGSGGLAGFPWSGAFLGREGGRVNRGPPSSFGAATQARAATLVAPSLPAFEAVGGTVTSGRDRMVEHGPSHVATGARAGSLSLAARLGATPE